MVLRQLFSLTVAGAVSGLCKQPIARTDFPFHRAAKGSDGTLSKRSYVSDGEVRCQLVCLADFRLINLRPTGGHGNKSVAVRALMEIHSSARDGRNDGLRASGSSLSLLDL